MRCYAPEPRDKGCSFPYPPKAIQFKSIKDAKDYYSQALFEASRFRQELGTFWIYIGEAIGDEVTYGYPDVADIILTTGPRGGVKVLR